MRFRYLIIIGIVILLPFCAFASDLKMALDVKVDTKANKLSGTARLSTATPLKTMLYLGNLQGVVVDGKAVARSDKPLALNVAADAERVLTFEATFDPGGPNHIDSDNVFLTGNWFPKPQSLATYSLSVTLPKGFLAVSEADAVTVRPGDETNSFCFLFDHLADGLSLAASRNYVRKKDRYNQIAIEAYFFKEDAHLANDYLAFTKKYLAMYEKMLTPYPFKRFVIAENVFPTGYSMPTYTLLGRTVVRLPFITRTSLGHEILHQWFGNSVYIDSALGNWAEGLTSYLADHHYADLKGEGALYRKQILVNYDAYVNDSNKMPLADFHSSRNKAESAMGYGKGAMIFHELRHMVGDERFFDSFREFLTTHRFRQASWADIQKSFEKINQTDLADHFTQWLGRDDISRLKVEEPELKVVQGRLTANFVIVQEPPHYHLHVPVTVHTSEAKRHHMIPVNQAREPVRILLDEIPTRVVVDDNYDLMRALAPSEVPATLAKILGKKTLLVIMDAKQAEKYQPILDALAVKERVIRKPEEVTFEEINTHTVVFAGYDLSPVSMLFGRQPTYKDGVRLDILDHPYNQKEAVMLLHVKNEGEAKAVRRKLPHYGKYNKLIFDQGKIIHKTQGNSPDGIPVLAYTQAQAINPNEITSLGDILTTLKESRVIYVGEQHEKYAHHMNQLMVIKKLHEAGVKVAVGMEMFQIPYQRALNDYLAGRINERAFLKASFYFDKWRFDYNLYKPIIDYLKKEAIPLVALNIEGDISRKTARIGLQGLSATEKRQLPAEMDYSNSNYRKDLFKVFGHHGNQHQLQNFDYFLQAQVLWDETMAESVHAYLASHPETTMVVLAGNGHLRKKYGIPNRVYRRNGLSFTVIVQDESIEPGIADFVLNTTPLKGTKAPLLGVAIETKDQAVHIVSVAEKSPAGKVGLKKGDIIVQVAGQKIESVADLKYVLFYTSLDSTISIEVKRKKKKLTKELTLFEFKPR